MPPTGIVVELREHDEPDTGYRASILSGHDHDVADLLEAAGEHATVRMRLAPLPVVASF